MYYVVRFKCATARGAREERRVWRRNRRRRTSRVERVTDNGARSATRVRSSYPNPVRRNVQEEKAAGGCVGGGSHTCISRDTRQGGVNSGDEAGSMAEDNRKTR